MTAPLTHVLQFMTNRPLAVTDDHAALIVAALRSELNIGLLETVEGRRLGAHEMDLLAATGRAAADGRAQRRQERERVYALVDGIAIIPIQGTLVKTWGINPYSGRTGYDGIKAKLYEALQDPDVKGIWLDIESPGGITAGMFDLSDAIFASNERNGGKPIWAIADETCASAAFCLGSAADKLFTPRTGVVGSVGVVAIYMNERAALEKDGIGVQVFRSSKMPRKMALNSYEDPDDETIERFQKQIDDLTDLFVSTVARNLRLSKKAVAETEGLTYIGEEARAVGFVSAVASWDQAWTKFNRHLSR